MKKSLKDIDVIRNYFLEEIEQNELMSRKHKKVCTTLSYIKNFLILVSTITGCISIYGFNFYKSIIKKKKKKHDKIVLLAKSKLNSIKVLISKTLINSSNSHDEFVLIDNVLNEYDDMTQKIRNFKT